MFKRNNLSIRNRNVFDIATFSFMAVGTIALIFLILFYVMPVKLADIKVPIAIDLATLFGPSRPFWLGVLYAVSNVVTALFAALLIYKMYRLAGQTKEVNDLERKYVQEKHDRENHNK